MATPAPRTAEEFIAHTRDAANELAELARQQWPMRGGRRIEDAVKAHGATLLHGVAALPREQQMEALVGIVSTLLYSLVSVQEVMMQRSALGRHGL
jgi:hypothetical protein